MDLPWLVDTYMLPELKGKQKVTTTSFMPTLDPIESI